MRGVKNLAVLYIDNISYASRRSFSDYAVYKNGGTIGVMTGHETEGCVYAALYGSDGHLVSVRKTEGAGTMKFEEAEEGAYMVL